MTSYQRDKIIVEITFIHIYRATDYMRLVLGDEHLFEPWVPFRDNPATAAALATEASEQASKIRFI